MSKQSFNEFNENIHNAKSRFINDLERILIKTSLRLERRAKLNATSYPKVVTGRLRSSISGLTDSKLGSHRIKLKAGGSISGADVEYAKYIELGTRFIKPRLFLNRAIESERESLNDQLSDLLHVTMGAD